MEGKIGDVKLGEMTVTFDSPAVGKYGVQCEIVLNGTSDSEKFELKTGEIDYLRIVDTNSVKVEEVTALATQNGKQEVL